MPTFLLLYYLGQIPDKFPGTHSNGKFYTFKYLNQRPSEDRTARAQLVSRGGYVLFDGAVSIENFTRTTSGNPRRLKGYP